MIAEAAVRIRVRCAELYVRALRLQTRFSDAVEAIKSLQRLLLEVLIGQFRKRISNGFPISVIY